MFVSQIAGGGVVVRRGGDARLLNNYATTYELAMSAIDKGEKLTEAVERVGLAEPVDLAALAADGQLDCPLRHPDPAHLFVTGTGLTHTGSADTRDAMHTEGDDVTDSMKMFRMGLESGKPAPGQAGVQPEWFYKGTGEALVAPGAPLVSPDFALDGGEEPEIAGLYLIASDGQAVRLGFALGNEFSDHVTEKINYLYLAHSKLRQVSFGPEILIGDLPDDVRGTSRIRRGGEVLWEKPFLSGEANMSHTIANLEHHHFKYGIFRQPGDVHVHMFGTATLSFADGIAPQNGDVFEIEAAAFGLPLVNPLQSRATPAEPLVTVTAL